MKLLENIDINNYVIELMDKKNLSYGPIYAFTWVELETLKA